jgi:uncharacterized Zn-binding protein involved in type VI secretion
MRTPSALLAVLTLTLVTPQAAQATGRPAIEAARDIWGMIQQLRGDHDSAQAGVRPQALQPASAGEAPVDLSDLSHPARLESRLAPLTRLPPARMRATVAGGQGRVGDYSVGSEQTVQGHLLILRGDADVYGRVQGNVVAVDGDITVHTGAVIQGDVLAIHGKVREQGGVIDGEIRTLSAAPAGAAVTLSPMQLTLRRLAGLAGVAITLGVLGLGLVAFGRHNLEIVSDTVSHSFGRAFVTGLLGQILLLPTFGMIVVGLVLSVAGILLLPFAVAAYVLLAVVGLVGGYLAVAHALGETYTRRRLAQGTMVAAPNSYRFLLTGLIAMLALWLAWAAFGWVPVAGDLIRGAAILVTWLLGTAGFGAALLSRAGVRENFAGRIIPPEALTDEYLWATPQFGVPAVRRPGVTRSPTGGP